MNRDSIGGVLVEQPSGNRVINMRTLGMVIFAFVFWVGACQRQQKVVREADTALELAVHDTFVSDPDAKGATSNVTVSASNGTVTLKGTVDTPADRVRAERLARQTNGVVNVVNDIVATNPKVIPTSGIQFDEKATRNEAARNGEQIGAGPKDARIYAEVRRKLVVMPGTPKPEIFVDVVNGNVTLRGMIFTVEAHREAVAAARRVEGVNDVNDRLLVNTVLP
jgi:osmotically-inducible protein OsmY